MSNIDHLRQLSQLAERLGQYNVGNSGLAVVRNLCCVAPRNKDCSEIEIQFIDRKSWLQFAKHLQAMVRQKGWTAKRISRMTADGVSIHQAYCCYVHLGDKYREESIRFHEWIDRLMRYA